MDVPSYDDYINSVLATKGPRCGCIDSQNLGESRWGLTRLTYTVENYVTGQGLTKDSIDQDLAWALQQWANITPLTFERVTDSSRANIVITAARGRNNGMDGPSGILAWCQLPSGRNFTGQVTACMDLDERWNIQIPIRAVMCHEFGHGLGLSHSNMPNQLMNPYLSKISTPQANDTNEIQTLYGPRPNPSPEPTAPTAPPTPGSGPSPGLIVPKAIKLQLSNGDVYGFSNPIKLPPNALTEGDAWRY